LPQPFLLANNKSSLAVENARNEAAQRAVAGDYFGPLLTHAPLRLIEIRRVLLRLAKTAICYLRTAAARQQNRRPSEGGARDAPAAENRIITNKKPARTLPWRVLR
jgi:hypothetical protein